MFRFFTTWLPLIPCLRHHRSVEEGCPLTKRGVTVCTLVSPEIGQLAVFCVGTCRCVAHPFLRKRTCYTSVGTFSKHLDWTCLGATAARTRARCPVQPFMLTVDWTGVHVASHILFEWVNCTRQPTVVTSMQYFSTTNSYTRATLFRALSPNGPFANFTVLRALLSVALKNIT